MGGRRASLIVVTAVAAALTVAAPAWGSTARPAELALVEAINEVRATHGLRLVVVAPALLEKARGHARELLARDEFFHGHLRPGTGEVLAWGTREVMGARAVVHRWMLSAQHRAILLSPAAWRAGVGVALGGFQGEAGVRLVVVRLSR